MVNDMFQLSPAGRTRIGLVVRVYVAIAVLTVVTLVVLGAAGSAQAPQEAWVHAIIVLVFAVLLPLRLRAASRGSVGGLRAVGIICAVLFLANVIEAMLTIFPGWMRVEMILIALLMLAGIGLVVRERV